MKPPKEIENWIKFDFNSSKESVLNVLCLLSFVAIFLGFPDTKTHRPAIVELILGGMAATAFFGILRLTTDDYILIDPSANSVWLHNKILFFKKLSYYCAVTDILEVRLHTQLRKSKHSSYTDFSIHLLFPGGVVRKSVNSVSLNREAGYQFNHKVAELRDEAVKISGFAGCKVVYGEKIPPKERLQSGDNKEVKVNFEVKKIEQKKQSSATDFSRPSPEPAEIIESDFMVENEKKCSSCGGSVPFENKFCIHCGNKMP